MKSKWKADQECIFQGITYLERKTNSISMEGKDLDLCYQ